MKQVVQSVGDGRLRVVEVALPGISPTTVLVSTRRSLVSSGTEKAVRELASASLLQKARARPDLVRQVVSKARADGLRSTLQAVRGRLDEDMPLGYSAAGVVLELGQAVAGIRPGQRVATASAGHAEVQVVPGLLAVPIPDDVSDSAAAFGAIAAIALQGLRQADVSTGGTVCVVGLGLVGQLTARLALASGLDVVGIDLREWTSELVTSVGGLGLVDVGRETTDAILERTKGRLADAVILTAATKSSEPVMAAVARVRDRGRIVVVGDVGLDLARTPFYEKEVDLRFARSYGPGRYERSYEEFGIDMPPGHVRWTEGRNIEAYLDLVARRRIAVDDLVSHVFAIDDAEKAYATLADDPHAMAVQFSYDASVFEGTGGVSFTPRTKPSSTGVGLVGAGNFAKITLMPALKAAGWCDFVAVTSSGGLSARHLAERHAFELALPDADDVVAQERVKVVFVLSRHDSHAALTAKALRAGKHVFVEKPLALSDAELDDVLEAYSASQGHLWVGFNRRHSEAVDKAAAVLRTSTGPLVATYRVSAGRLPANHWYKDRRQGGRLLGEVCHFVDTVSWLVGAAPVGVVAMGSGVGECLLQEDLIVSVRYADGSVASVTYSQDGHDSTSKERLEILGRGHSILIDDFRKLEVDGQAVRLSKPDKGHVANLALFRDVVLGKADGAHELQASIATTRTMLAAAQSLTSGCAESIE